MRDNNMDLLIVLFLIVILFVAVIPMINTTGKAMEGKFKVEDIDFPDRLEFVSKDFNGARVLRDKTTGQEFIWINSCPNHVICPIPKLR